MNSGSKNRRSADGLDPTAEGLLRNPLEFVAEDHMHVRAMCVEIEGMAQGGTVSPVRAGRMVSFLSKELPLLISDEDKDLFPLLARRCEPEDEIERLRARLEREHRAAMDRLPAVKAAFERLAAAKGRPRKQERQDMQAFADALRRHLIFENAVAMPLARARLTESDLETLRLRMMQRRGLDRLMETPDAE